MGQGIEGSACESDPNLKHKKSTSRFRLFFFFPQHAMLDLRDFFAKLFLLFICLFSCFQYSNFVSSELINISLW